MLTPCDQNASNGDLLKNSVELKTNLSMEQALTNQLNKQAQHWLEKNNSSIASYNKSVDEDGIFSDGIRDF